MMLQVRHTDYFKVIFNADRLSATTVLLYSRLSGMTTIFNIQHPTSSSGRAISTSDPCLLQLLIEPEDLKTSEIRCYSSNPKRRISALALRLVPFGFYNAGPPSGLGQLYVENDVTFYQLSIMFNDLSLSECLYWGAGAGLDLEIRPPDTRIQKGIVKTATKVPPDFIVPDGFEDQDSDDNLEETRPQLPTMGASSTLLEIASEDPWTISLEWLEEELHEVESSNGRAFDEILEHLYDAIGDRCVGGSPDMEIL